MKDSWKNKVGTDWSIEAALQTLEDLGGQFKRNVDMRMRRGDVRSAILRLLNESPMHGYQIIHQIETRSGGAWKPSPGSVYPTLQLLADEGLIEAHEADGRRTYSLTASGSEAAAKELNSPAPWLTGSERQSGPRGTLAKAGVRVAKAAAEVGRIGSADQLAAASKILDDASEALSHILSQD